MEYPILNSTDTSREMIEVFGGYNHNLRINDGEFYDENNLTSTHYPLLAPRTHRGLYGKYDTTVITEDNLRGKPLGLLEKDALCYVYKSGTNLHFVMNEYDYDLGMTTIDETEERQLISMGAYVVIMPDKLYINTKNTSDKGILNSSPALHPQGYLSISQGLYLIQRLNSYLCCKRTLAMLTPTYSKVVKWFWMYPKIVTFVKHTLCTSLKYNFIQNPII